MLTNSAHLMLGAALALATSLVMSLAAAAIKYAAAFVSIEQIVLLQYLVCVAVMLPWLWHKGPTVLKTERPLDFVNVINPLLQVLGINRFAGRAAVVLDGSEEYLLESLISQHQAMGIKLTPTSCKAFTYPPPWSIHNMCACCVSLRGKIL